MHQGHYVFAQLMQHLPLTTFRRCVARCNGEYRIQQFSCLDQYLCLAFAQLTWRESLRDIEACLRAQSSKLYHLGFRSAIARNTLANANAVRDWRIYADFAQHLIGIARRLYARSSPKRAVSVRPRWRCTSLSRPPRAAPVAVIDLDPQASASSQVAESVIVSGLTDKAAYRLESRVIGEFHKYRAGQLWNTIDERFMHPRSLPDEWDDPEHPLYKLPRPLCVLR
jgi:Domain of unknown function (DUF4372)